ncbi:hypothetical protein HMSSN036_51280 [Paenibacillus macerans]|nr:hypothetical protein HMSSN036_51280 [Paenibacillus macerans]
MTTYREIREEDAERHLSLCLKLDQETKFMLLEPGERKTSAEAHQERIRSITESSNSTIIVAEDNGELVGYLAVNGGGANKIKHLGHIVIGILKDYTGKGVGTALFQAAEACEFIPVPASRSSNLRSWCRMRLHRAVQKDGV